MVPGGGRALIDREFYLPESRVGDRDRCSAAGVADDVAFATKPELARAMIGRAVQAAVPFGWVAGDEAYGQNTDRRLPGRGRQRSAGSYPVPAASATATSRPTHASKSESCSGYPATTRPQP